MEGNRSVTFDRARDYYDRTRALSAGAMAALLAQAVDELRGCQRVLDAGAGTGRFTLPLNDAGIPIVALDLSEPMLTKIVEKGGGTAPLPLVVGDARALPFEPGSFDAAVAVHLLHLIADWEEAIDELVRVVSPGGRILVDPGGWGEGSLREIYQVFCDAAGLPLEPIGVATPEELDSAMTERGAAARVLEEVIDRRSFPYRTIVKMLEDGVFSFTWQSDESARRAGTAAVRSHLAGLDLSLDDILAHERPITWRTYTLP